MPEGTTMDDMPFTPVGETEALKDIRARIPAHIKPAEDMPEPWNRETDDDAEGRRSIRRNAITKRWTERRPAMYANASVADLDVFQHGTEVGGWLMSGGVHLVLAGPVGTGKTFAAYAVGNQAVDILNLGTEAWTVHDLLQDLRPGGDPLTITRVENADLLILDDLDGTATEWEAETLTAILDARLRNQRRTIVTTNITGEQIAQTWGSRLMDRLRYRLTALTFTGESRRKADW